MANDNNDINNNIGNNIADGQPQYFFLQLRNMGTLLINVAAMITVWLALQCFLCLLPLLIQFLGLIELYFVCFFFCNVFGVCTLNLGKCVSAVSRVGNLIIVIFCSLVCISVFFSFQTTISSLSLMPLATNIIHLSLLSLLLLQVSVFAKKEKKNMAAAVNRRRRVMAMMMTTTTCQNVICIITEMLKMCTCVCV